MAIYPQTISEDIVSDKRRRAEMEVLEALKATLPDEFHVFYNCDWYHESETSYRQDGEADFIVAHEVLGIAILEVKGGIISRREEDRQWLSKDRAGKIHNIKNPIQQAKASKHVLLDKLKEHLGDRLGYVQLKHAAIFPDSGRPKSDADLGADMPLELLFFMEDMPILGPRIIKLLAASANTQYAKIGKAGIEVLVKLFNQGFHLEPRVSSSIKSCEFQIRAATEQQKRILKMTESAHRLAISGGAGTGKTSLAIEKVRALGNAGKRTLFLCFNAPLCLYLRTLLHGNSHVEVYSFHQFCLKTISAAGISLPKGGDAAFWEELPYLLLEALQQCDQKKYDAVVVDEGQDFHREWIEALLLSLKAPDEGVFYLFYDDNQRLYPNTANLADLVSKPLRLFENVRNAKPIFHAARAFYPGDLESLGPDGPAIEWETSSKEMRDRSLEKLLNKLVNNEGVAQSEIAVLTARPYETYKPVIGRYKCKRADELSDNAVVFDSIYRFKGLEKEVVILIDLGIAIDKTSLLYVGFSRARSLMLVLDEPETIKLLQAHTAVA